MFIPIFTRLINQFSIVLYSDCMENKFSLSKDIKTKASNRLRVLCFMNINCDCLLCLNNDEITKGFIARPKTLGKLLRIQY